MRKNQNDTKKPSPELVNLLKIDRLFPVNRYSVDARFKLEKQTRKLESKIFKLEMERDWNNSTDEDLFFDRQQYREQEMQTIFDDLGALIIHQSTALNFQKGIDYIHSILPETERNSAESLVKTFIEIEDNRQTLGKIARHPHLRSTLTGNLNLENPLHAGRLFQTNYFDIQINVGVSVNEQGKLDFLTNPVIKALQNAEAERLRFCPVCLYVYWAIRINARTCSQKCANVLKQRILRADKINREQINFKRRQNYAYKQAIKKEKAGQK